MDAKSKVVLVTGGGRGIGRAVAVRFALDKATVAVAARSKEELRETQTLVEMAGGRCTTHTTDLQRGEQVDALIDDVVRAHGRIDVLVNSAGLAPLARIEELDPATFDSLMSINVTAIYRTCRRVWGVMKQQGGGVIVNISSIASADAFPGFAAYGASKAWVNAWSKTLAEEGRAHGIRVFAVAPGGVETRMLRGAFPDFPADQTLQPSDVAEVVWGLAQPPWRYATGETVFVRRNGDA